jgi:hypothetical protein
MVVEIVRSLMIALKGPEIRDEARDVIRHPPSFVATLVITIVLGQHSTPYIGRNSFVACTFIMTPSGVRQIISR